VAGAEALSPVHLDLHVALRRRKSIIVSARRKGYNRFQLFLDGAVVEFMEYYKQPK
jgi:hypothetical protein